jgi:hypothetical protein
MSLSHLKSILEYKNYLGLKPFLAKHLVWLNLEESQHLNQKPRKRHSAQSPESHCQLGQALKIRNDDELTLEEIARGSEKYSWISILVFENPVIVQLTVEFYPFTRMIREEELMLVQFEGTFIDSLNPTFIRPVLDIE